MDICCLYVIVSPQEIERLEKERQALAALREKERLAKMEEERKVRQEEEEKRRMREEERVLKVKGCGVSYMVRGILLFPWYIHCCI